MSSRDCIKCVDDLGNVLKKTFCIAKFETLGAPLDMTIYSQTKFFKQTQECNGGYIYHLYKYFDEREMLDRDFEIKIIAVKTKDRRRSKLLIAVTATCTTDNIDGKL